MISDDALYKFRLRVFALAGELGDVQAACRVMGVPPLDLLPLATSDTALWPQHPASPGAPSAQDAQRHLSLRRAAGGRLCAGAPRLRSRPASRPSCAGPSGVGSAFSANGGGGSVPPWARSPGPSDLALVRRLRRAASCRAPAGHSPERHIEADRTLVMVVQMDCFYVGRLSWHQRRAVWQYTAIDVATLLQLGRAARPGPVKHPSCPMDLRPWPTRSPTSWLAKGWQLETVTTDNALRVSLAVTSTAALDRPRTLNHIDGSVAGQTHSPTAASNESSETILEECWKPAFARHF